MKYIDEYYIDEYNICKKAGKLKEKYIYAITFNYTNITVCPNEVIVMLHMVKIIHIHTIIHTNN